MKAAESAARQEIATLVREYRAAGWSEAVGSSGTARSIESILRENGFSEESITREGLERLRALLIKQEAADPARIPGLRPSRAAVLPGGLAILGAVFDELEVERMTISDGALRHGVLYDLLGRFEHRDMREVTVQQFVRRYRVDAAQGERVRAMALAIYDAVTAGSGEAAAEDEDPDRALLVWAAKLAEVGLSIAHADYHKHSAYVLSSADMPGFSRMEQQRLARIVLAHRGKLGKMQDSELEGRDWWLVFALRLATTILRRRSDVRLPLLRVAADAAGFALELPQAWLEENPLTADALEAESGYWKAVGMRFEVSGLSDRRVAAIAAKR
jgi:exopolyphosphatase/guanosine-5'-triphosphate,3'-diphosphate pyrophosphatase